MSCVSRKKNLGFQIVFFRFPSRLRNILPATQATVAMKILLLEKPLSKAHSNILCNMSRIFYLLLIANFQKDAWAQATREDDPRVFPAVKSKMVAQRGGTLKRLL